jgi:hypothetical protein
MAKRDPEKLAARRVKRFGSGSCVIISMGADTTCPMCHTLVKSGKRHECRVVDGKWQVVAG